MSVGTFMDSLEKLGVVFDLADGVLCVAALLGALSEAQRHELAARRDEVERLVRVALGPYGPNTRLVTAPVDHAQLTLGEAA
jgi:hypothetical protein